MRGRKLGETATYIALDVLIELRVSLLNVLSPKLLALEQLCAFRDLAPEFGFVLLLDVLAELFLQSFLHWLASKLSQVDTIGIEYLQKLLFKGLDPVEGS